jgi:hypothetical protein
MSCCRSLTLTPRAPDDVTNESVTLDPVRRSNALGPRTPQALEMMPPTCCRDFF